MDKFNGGYIKASQEAYDLLIELGYTAMHDKTHPYNSYKKWKYFFINRGNNNLDACNVELKDYKQFYINNGDFYDEDPFCWKNNKSE